MTLAPNGENQLPPDELAKKFLDQLEAANSHLRSNVPSEQETKEFLAQVDDVVGKVNQIMKGDMADFDDFDTNLRIKERAKVLAAQEKKDKVLRQVTMGRDGKGAGENYKMFCRRCHTEYVIEISICSRCQGPLMPQEARRKELMGRVEELKVENANHARRKDKWIRWKKSQALIGKSKCINYKAWEFWEPETDEEDEPEPIVPKDDPQFKVLEADIIERNKKRDEKKIAATKCKNRGNENMKEGDFVGAIEVYAEGLELMKDMRPLWTNKALAELKVFRYQDAVDSASKVLELAEIFDDGYHKHPDMCIKGLLRRAQGYRGLHMWSEAVDDLKEAVKLGSPDADDLLRRTEAALKEANEARDLIAQSTNQKKEEEHASSLSQKRKIAIEEEEEASLEDFSDNQFSSLAKQLLSEEKQRLLFCARVDGKSRLDGVLRATERSCTMWKKAKGMTKTNLHAAYRSQVTDTDKSAQSSTMAHLEKFARRCIQVLRIVCANSSLHAELCVTAVRHVLFFVHSENLRGDALTLLSVFTEFPSTVAHVTNILSRNTEHVAVLVEIVTSDDVKNVIPVCPPADDAAKFTILPCAAESSLKILGRIASDSRLRKCLWQPHAEVLVQMVMNFLKRVQSTTMVIADICELLKNLIGSDASGSSFADKVVNGGCMTLVIECIKKEVETKGKDYENRVAHFLEILFKLLNVSNNARQHMFSMRCLSTFVLLAEKSSIDIVRVLALMTITKTLLVAPKDNTDLEIFERRLMNLVNANLDLVAEPFTPWHDAIVRLLTLLVTEGPSLSRWRRLNDATSQSKGHQVVQKIIDLVRRLKPTAYAEPGTTTVRATMLGNMSLVCSRLAAEEHFDLSKTIAVFVDALRKEVGGPQNNAGVCVTKLAMVERYKPLVRSLKGFESLHQIQLRNQQQRGHLEEMRTIAIQTN
eukprot:GEMP01011310.1.p1 GENE.GEMP01011310.1~~GEMP01011310.1.p1  ORF type:complete len:931 (+),score=227.39 GEMP01011310.1:143-2935(+)